MTTANREQRRSRVIFADHRIFQISTIPLPDGNALFTMMNISDSAQVEQALRDRNTALSEADAVKGRFLANMSYEFRTPLTSISGFADLLKAGIAGELNPKAMEYVDAIVTSADRLSQQINTVLDFSQSEAGALPIARAPFDVVILLKEVVAAHKDEAAARQISLELELSDDKAEISGDRARISQAITHLTDNAVRYSSENGRVVIVLQTRKNYIEIFVSDDGPGISQKDQAAVFDGFGRSINSDTADAPGLGLALARELVRAHNGELVLESEIGQGTTVLIKLPRK